MTFYYIMRKNKIVNVEDLCKPKEIKGKKYIFIDNVGNGTNVESETKYITSGGFILIEKDEDNEPYVIDRKSKEKYNIYNIHFQGDNKKFLNQDLINNLKNKDVKKLLSNSYTYYIIGFLTLLVILLYLAKRKFS